MIKAFQSFNKYCFPLKNTTTHLQNKTKFMLTNWFTYYTKNVLDQIQSQQIGKDISLIKNKYNPSSLSFYTYQRTFCHSSVNIINTLLLKSSHKYSSSNEKQKHRQNTKAGKQLGYQYQNIFDEIFSCKVKQLICFPIIQKQHGKDRYIKLIYNYQYENTKINFKQFIQAIRQKSKLTKQSSSCFILRAPTNFSCDYMIINQLEVIAIQVGHNRNDFWEILNKIDKIYEKLCELAKQLDLSIRFGFISAENVSSQTFERLLKRLPQETNLFCIKQNEFFPNNGKKFQQIINSKRYKLEKAKQQKLKKLKQRVL